MPEFERTPSWRWNEDGDTVTGKVVGLRQVESQFKPGSLVTVMDVETPTGVKSLWCDSWGLRRFIEVEGPQAGDTVVVQRTGKKEFTTKAGDVRSMWEYHTECHRPSQGSDFPAAEPEPQPAPVADDDIPF